MEQGILIAGDVLSDTDWCRREPDAWWEPKSRVKNKKWAHKGAMALDSYQLRKRKGTLNIITGHWTAGEAGTKSYLDDGARVVRVMKRRASRKRPGRRLKVSVQFVIGACGPDDEYAPIWQTMDLGLGWAATHVGRGEVNCRSIGVEVVNAGLDGQANVRDREEVERRYLGKVRHPLEFYGGQLRSWVRLCNALSDKSLPTNIEIPRQVPCTAHQRTMGKLVPMRRRFTRKEQREWQGAMEHYCMDNTTKVDAGQLLLQALIDAGWGRVRI